MRFSSLEVTFPVNGDGNRLMPTGTLVITAIKLSNSNFNPVQKVTKAFSVGNSVCSVSSNQVGLEAFPNLVRDFFMEPGPNGDEVEMVLMSGEGKVIKLCFNTTVGKFNFQSGPNGIYFFKNT